MSTLQTHLCASRASHVTAGVVRTTRAACVSAVNASNVTHYEYGPFGEVIRTTGSIAKTNPFRFSSKYYDDETHFVYYGHRYYNGATGMWLSRDPLGENGGKNLYCLNRNDSINKIDLLGLSMIDSICCRDECSPQGAIEIVNVEVKVLPTQMNPALQEFASTLIEDLHGMSLGAELIDLNVISLAVNNSIPSITSAYESVVNDLTTTQFVYIWTKVSYRVCTRVSCWVVYSRLKWINNSDAWKSYSQGAFLEFGYSGLSEAQDYISAAIQSNIQEVVNGL
jgi:RHS repeat-associated protein